MRGKESKRFSAISLAQIPQGCKAELIAEVLTNPVWKKLLF
jgi:hypothetical protein